MDDPFVEVTRGTISAESYASAVYDTRNSTFLEFTAFHEKIAASFSYEAVTDCLLSTNSWIIHKPSIELWFLVEKFSVEMPLVRLKFSFMSSKEYSWRHLSTIRTRNYSIDARDDGNSHVSSPVGSGNANAAV